MKFQLKIGLSFIITKKCKPQGVGRVYNTVDESSTEGGGAGTVDGDRRTTKVVYSTSCIGPRGDAENAGTGIGSTDIFAGMEITSMENPITEENGGKIL
jgi:hypothetical protein